MSLRPNAWMIAKLAAAFALAGGLAAAQPQPPPESAPKTQEEVPPGPPPGPSVAQDPIKEKPVEAAPSAPKPPPTPARRTRYDIAVLEALDKVTAESLRFEAPVGRPIRYRGLIFTVKACERTAPDEAVDDAVAYLTIDSQPRAQPGKPPLAPRQVFKGWMYASSPGLNPLQHPVYDAWLITCRAGAPVNPPAPEAAAPTLAAPKPPVAAPKPPSTATQPAANPPAARPLPEVVASPTTPPTT